MGDYVLDQGVYYRDEWQENDIFRFFLIGADHQTRWAFGAPGSPVRLHKTPTGLEGAPFEHDMQEIVGMDGALYRGTTDKPLTITLKVWIVDPRSSAWARRQHSRWRDSLVRGKEPCRLFVVSKESGYWWADVRVNSIQEVDYHDNYPGELGETGEAITLVSDRSFFQRFDEVKVFDRETCKQARLVNVGSQPAWLRYTITGGHSGVEIGIGKDTVKLPGTYYQEALHIDGEMVSGYYIDTDELWPNLLSSTGRDLLPHYPHAYWRKPLPPRGQQRGGATPITINPINPDHHFKVEVAYTPRTEQPW